MWQQAERVGDPVPARRLAEQCDEIDAIGNAGENIAEAARGDRWQSLAPPQTEIEICVLGTEETDERQRAFFRAAEWPQKDRLAGACVLRGVEAADLSSLRASATTV